MADLDVDEILEELKKDPPPKVVKEVDGFEYLEGWYCKHRANELFTPFGWSYTIAKQWVLGTGKLDNEKGTPFADAMAMIRLEIDVPDTPLQTRKEEVGYCRNQGSSTADAEQSALKGAVTDGIKRCLGNLGATFGLHFKSDFSGPSEFAGKLDTRRRQRSQSGQRSGSNGTTEAQATQIEAIRKLLGQTTFDEDDILDEWAEKGYDYDRLEELTYGHAEDTIKALQ